MTASDNLVDWIERQYAIAAREMLKSVSATGLEHHRPAMGQTVRPAKGSVLASPVSAHYDPEPDYFFHWLRDSAAVTGAIGELMKAGMLGAEGHQIIADIVRFSLGLDRLDGTSVADDAGHGAGVLPETVQFLRPRDELASVHGDRVRMETRFNPDGSLDILRWARPQLDGPAFRALTLMRHLRSHGGPEEARALVEGDVGFTLRHAGADGFDIWEERCCADYYTRSLQARALAEAADVAAEQGRAERAHELRGEALRVEALLDDHWSPARNAYLSAAGQAKPSDRDVDFAVVLAAIHAGREDGPHSVMDPRMQATLAALADVFAADYAINLARPDAAPAMGRFRGDIYQSGGAFYFSTLGAAEFHYMLSEALGGEPLARRPEDVRFLTQVGASATAGLPGEDAARCILRGDAFMETVRRFTPADGALSEQFDQSDGRQTSARHLAWSYAAFITAAAARRRAVARQDSGFTA